MHYECKNGIQIRCQRNIHTGNVVQKIKYINREKEKSKQLARNENK